MGSCYCCWRSSSSYLFCRSRLPLELILYLILNTGGGKWRRVMQRSNVTILSFSNLSVRSLSSKMDLPRYWRRVAHMKKKKKEEQKWKRKGLTLGITPCWCFQCGVYPHQNCRRRVETAGHAVPLLATLATKLCVGNVARAAHGHVDDVFYLNLALSFKTSVIISDGIDSY